MDYLPIALLYALSAVSLVVFILSVHGMRKYKTQFKEWQHVYDVSDTPEIIDIPKRGKYNISIGSESGRINPNELFTSSDNMDKLWNFAESFLSNVWTADFSVTKSEIGELIPYHNKQFRRIRINDLSIGYFKVSKAGKYTITLKENNLSDENKIVIQHRWSADKYLLLLEGIAVSPIGFIGGALIASLRLAGII